MSAAVPSCLLDRPRLGRMEVEEEQRVQIAMADLLRAWSIEGRLRAIWCAVPNELPLPRHLAHMAAGIGAKRKAMGCHAGAADLVVTWAGGSGWIEVKRASGVESGQRVLSIVGDQLRARSAPAGRLSPTQREWREWCTQLGVRHAVLHDPRELEPLLVEWGPLAAERRRE